MLRCNGVFKGGGAKGVAYVGALEACEEHGIGFEAVAGSSAGAITAVLVAAGLDAAELHLKMPQALATIQSPRRAALRFARSSLLSNDRLSDWLDRVLVEQLERRDRVPADGSRCTFDDLFAATGIGLFVVAIDLATRQPIVFSHELTPRMPVADAVVASCAIPVAFPPSLVEFDGEVHRLADGGAYANYPSFVFEDPAFRAFHQLPPPEDVPTIGFVLDQAGDELHGAAVPGVVRRVAFATDRGSVERELGIVGATIGSPLVRWSLILLPMLFAVITTLWLIAEADRSFPVIGSLPDSLDPLEDVGLLLLLLTVATVGIVGAAGGLVLARFGRELLDGGTMGAVAAMGVGPNVPYWVGASGTGRRRHIAVRLTVPRELTTLSFAAPSDVVERAIATARVTTSEHLSSAFGAVGTDVSPTGAAPVGAVPDHTGPLDGSTGTRRRWAMGLLRRPTLTSLWVSVALGVTWFVVFTLVAIAAYQGLANFAQDRVGSGIVWLVGSGIGMLVGLIAFAARKHAVATTPFPILRRVGDRMLWLTAFVSIVGIAMIVIAALSDGRASIAAVARTTSVEATVVHVDAARYVVAVRITGDDPSIDDLRRALRDQNGTVVTPCAFPVPVSDRCLVFEVDAVEGIRVGSSDTVRYDVDSGLAVLGSQRWSFGHTILPAFYLFALVGFLTLGHQSVRALRWRAHRGRPAPPRRAPSSDPA